jgi:hypothetical protein
LAITLKTSGNQKTCHKSSKLCNFKEKKKEERKLGTQKLEIIHIQAKKTAYAIIIIIIFQRKNNKLCTTRICE